MHDFQSATERYNANIHTTSRVFDSGGLGGISALIDMGKAPLRPDTRPCH